MNTNRDLISVPGGAGETSRRVARATRGLAIRAGLLPIARAGGLG